ncbi:MAG: protein kinase family protein [Pseudonocardiaceae bacterium]
MSGQTETGARRSGASWPTAGTLLEGGRYRLLSEVGRDDRCTAQLWRGRDLMLERDVALTLFVADPRNRQAESLMRSAVQRALRSARLEAAGAARVLDVLDPDSSCGPTMAAVVAEWTPGPHLVELVENGLPQPSVAASLLAPLAGAVDAAHRAGLVLGCDHPLRVRLTPDGHARLAFPGPPPETGPSDDIRGLGAALYLLLTGYWPLPGGPRALPAAPVGPDGSPLTPRTLRSEVPLELSTLALRSLAGSASGGVHTAAAVQRVLELNAASAAELDLFPGAGGRAAVDPEQAGRERRIKLGMSVTALVGATLLILGYVGMQLASVFAEGPSGPALIVGAPSSTTQAPPPAPPPPVPPPASAAPIPIVDLSVYDLSQQGSPDNEEDVDLIVDGDPSTGWSTDSYFQPFPAFKKGLGVMLRFEQPVAVSLVTVESPSRGTVLEVRAAPGPDAALNETILLGTATLGGGSTQIQLQPGPPTRYLLLWITELGGGGDQNQSELSEVGVQRRVF